MTRATTASLTSRMQLVRSRCGPLDDLVVRAAIAVHWSSLNTSAPDPDVCTERYAQGAVVRGVLDLAGLRFDAEGRLL